MPGSPIRLFYCHARRKRLQLPSSLPSPPLSYLPLSSRNKQKKKTQSPDHTPRHRPRNDGNEPLRIQRPRHRRSGRALLHLRRLRLGPGLLRGARSRAARRLRLHRRRRTTTTLLLDGNGLSFPFFLRRRRRRRRRCWAGSRWRLFRRRLLVWCCSLDRRADFSCWSGLGRCRLRLW